MYRYYYFPILIERFVGQVVSLNINPLGGVPKYPVNQIVIRTNGVEGDKQNDLKYHGGPTRAVCLFSFERIEQLRSEGHPIGICLLYTSPSPRDRQKSRMPSSA